MSDAGEEAQPGPRQPRLLLHAGLFLATFLTTTAAGALYAHGRIGAGLEGIPPISDGLSYSVPLMLILLSHELGHYFVARKHGVDASLPYFIPMPPTFFFLGTMGALIGMRGSPTDRKKLIDIGAAGPLAGLAVAIPVIWYGLAHSHVGALTLGGMQEGNSILYALLKRAVTGAWLPDGKHDVFMHPTLLAGWAGLLITMINLLPIGQLDGGHIAAAYFGNGYNAIAERIRRLLPVGAVVVFLLARNLLRAEAPVWNEQVGSQLAFLAAVPWLVWYLLATLLVRLSGGVNHPTVDDLPLPRSRKALFWLMVVVFIAVFMPVPFRTTLAGDPQATTSTSTTTRLE